MIVLMPMIWLRMVMVAAAAVVARPFSSTVSFDNFSVL